VRLRQTTTSERRLSRLLIGLRAQAAATSANGSRQSLCPSRRRPHRAPPISLLGTRCGTRIARPERSSRARPAGARRCRRNGCSCGTAAHQFADIGCQAGAANSFGTLQRQAGRTRARQSNEENSFPVRPAREKFQLCVAVARFFIYARARVSVFAQHRTAVHRVASKRGRVDIL
jgi:hypothetical protein